MVDLLHQLFNIVCHEETVPKQWKEGLIVNLVKKGDKEDPGNYRGIMLLSIVGKVFYKVVNTSIWIVVVNSCSLSPWLRIRGMALWMGGREVVSLVSSVTQGE